MNIDVQNKKTNMFTYVHTNIDFNYGAAETTVSRPALNHMRCG